MKSITTLSVVLLPGESNDTYMRDGGWLDMRRLQMEKERCFSKQLELF